ncbi:MAG: VanZ family protein [Candidatus Omnitrophica bacterium]|jgi:VanZ family protein|nr:VanZ family protein [Candidatus Omnitrophota bacterium]
MLKQLKLWGPVLIWAGLIFFFSNIPDLESGLKEDFILRKIAHIFEYFILTLFLFRAFKGSLAMNLDRLYIYPAALALLYAISDEFHQFFVDGRYCSLNDVMIDSIGIVVFYAMLIFMKGKTCSIK